MDDFDKRQLYEDAKRFVSEWSLSYQAEKDSADIAVCLERALRSRGYHDMPREPGVYARTPEFIALVADAQQRIRDEVARGVSYKGIDFSDVVRRLPTSFKSKHEAREYIFSIYKLVQSWKEGLLQAAESQENYGVRQPNRTFCDALGLRTDAEIARIAATFRPAGINLVATDCTVSVTFPDGVEAFWCVCKHGDVLKMHTAIDTSLTESVIGSGESEHGADAARREVLLFLYVVAESLEWH